MHRSFVLLLGLFALPAVAQIYKYTDANGNTAYSSQPPSNGTKAQTMDLPPLQRIDTVAPTARPPSPATQNQGQAPQNTAAYPVLEVTDVPTDEALRANNGTFTVGVRIQPRLQSGHLLQLVVDGLPYGQPGNVPRLQVMELDRGEHSLAVQVLQISDQKPIQQSQTVTLTVQRVHVGNR